MNDRLLTVLKEYGLKDKEARIYLIILELGKAPASTISRQVGLKRVSTYAIIQEMIAKGVVSQIDKKGVKLFSVIDPEQLYAQWQIKCQGFQSVLPEFAAITDVWGNKPIIQYYEGFSGMKELYSDMLTSTVDISAFVGVDSVNLELQKDLNQDHVKRRVELGIKASVLCNPTDMSLEYMGRDEGSLRETRMIDSDLFKLYNEIDMYGPNKVAIAMYSADEMSGVVIHSENFYKSMMSVFKFIWMSSEGKI